MTLIRAGNPGILMMKEKRRIETIHLRQRRDYFKIKGAFPISGEAPLVIFVCQSRNYDSDDSPDNSRNEPADSLFKKQQVA